MYHFLLPYLALVLSLGAGLCLSFDLSAEQSAATDVSLTPFRPVSETSLLSSVSIFTGREDDLTSVELVVYNSTVDVDPAN